MNAISKHERGVYGLLALAVVIYGLYFSLYQIQRHRAFETDVDLTNMEQVIWNTLHGRFMRATTYPTDTGRTITDFSKRVTENRLADHVQPILLLLALPYALVPRPETLLVVMSVAVGLGAIPVFRLAKRRLHTEGWALAFAVGYLLLPVVETNSGWDVHGMSFVPPLLLASLDAAEQGKRGWWWFWALLAMGCREDMPFLVGWAMFWMAPKAQRRNATLMLGWGTLWSILNFLVIIPSFGNEGSPYLVRFLPYGTPLTRQGVTNLLGQWQFWQVEVTKLLLYGLRLGFPFLFLCFLNWPALLAMAPTFILNGLNWFEPVIFPNRFHYAAPLVPWALIGALEGFLFLEDRLKKWKPSVNWRNVVGEALMVSMVAAHLVNGYTPLNHNFVWPRQTTRDAQLIAALEHISSQVTVSASPHLAAHLARRPNIRFFPDLRDAKWIAVDVEKGWDPYGGWRATLDTVRNDEDWEQVASGDGWVILRKVPAFVWSNEHGEEK